MTWYIWFDRNELVHGRKGRSCECLVAAAEAFLDSFMTARQAARWVPRGYQD